MASARQNVIFKCVCVCVCVCVTLSPLPPPRIITTDIAESYRGYTGWMTSRAGYATLQNTIFFKGNFVLINKHW